MTLQWIGGDKCSRSIAALLIMGATPWLAHSSGAETASPSGASVLHSVERTISKEPAYSDTPRYALMVFGTAADSRVWMVEDGRTLYVDRNANGDLTDDGPPLTPKEERELNAADGAKPHWDFDYKLDQITPAEGSPHTDFQLRRWNYADDADRYGLSVSVDGKVPMYAGWFGSFWADSPAAAPIIHFGGPLMPKMLRFKEFVIGSKFHRLSVCLVNPGGGEGATSRLSIEALPTTTTPMLTIDWPVAPNAPPLQTTHWLPERCCYWEFYELNFSVPEGVATGNASVAISLSDGVFPLELATDRIDVPVRAQETAAADN